MRDNWKQPTRSSELLLRLCPTAGEHTEAERAGELGEAGHGQQTSKDMAGVAGGRWRGWLARLGDWLQSPHWRKY